MYILSLPEMEVKTAKKIAKLNTYKGTPNYIYFNNTVIDF